MCTHFVWNPGHDGGVILDCIPPLNHGTCQPPTRLGHRSTVAILGANHLPGVEKELRALNASFSELEGRVGVPNGA